MLKFCGCEFSATGANKNSQVYGLTLNGAEDVLIEGCKFSGTGYSAILNKTAGSVIVKDCDFECSNFKNPIEGGQTVDQGALTIEDCEFNGVPGNNFINFYQVADGTVHTIKNCKFHGSTANNIIRLSNKNNVSATFNIEDIKYEFVSGTPDEYTGVILCQDYTNKTGLKQDFSKYHLNVNNLQGPKDTTLCYVYEDGAGIITGNWPTITVDGQDLLWGTGESGQGFQPGPSLDNL